MLIGLKRKENQYNFSQIFSKSNKLTPKNTKFVCVKIHFNDTLTAFIP
jgi:hypothetical protein